MMNLMNGLMMLVVMFVIWMSEIKTLQRLTSSYSYFSSIVYFLSGLGSGGAVFEGKGIMRWCIDWWPVSVLTVHAFWSFEARSASSKHHVVWLVILESSLLVFYTLKRNNDQSQFIFVYENVKFLQASEFSHCELWVMAILMKRVDEYLRRYLRSQISIFGNK